MPALFIFNSEELRQNLAGDVIDMVERLHKITLPGSVYATGIVAAILALDPNKYSFDYIDTLTTEGTAKDLDVFKVRMQKLVVV